VVARNDESPAVRRDRASGFLALVYHVPGLRSLADALYAIVARYRYRLFGREACDPDGTCHLH
jgi:predicted DCC family thiol-disulfide oxidoreductase YuxK